MRICICVCVYVYMYAHTYVTEQLTVDSYYTYKIISSHISTHTHTNKETHSNECYQKFTKSAVFSLRRTHFLTVFAIHTYHNVHTHTHTQ